MMERISAECYIDRQLDDRLLCGVAGEIADLKRTYISSIIGSDNCDFLTIAKSHDIDDEDGSTLAGEDTVEKIEYQAASANISAWISATAKQFLPDEVKIHSVDSKSVAVSIDNEKLPEMTRMWVIYGDEERHGVSPAIYLTVFGARVNDNDRVRCIDLAEFDERSVFGVDIRVLEAVVAQALIETYLVWRDCYANGERLLFY